MQYTSHYHSPLGEIWLAADDAGLIGLWFEGQKYFAARLSPDHREEDRPVLAQARHWLDLYFAGREPNFSVPLHFCGTNFQREVWQILCTIPYGETASYGAIARRLTAKHNLPRMSAQAVGGAIARNEISILVPCHRVIGAHGSLTGYAGGIDKKIALLTLEGAMQREFFVPKCSTAP